MGLSTVDGDIDFDARLDVDVDDLLEHLGRGVQVDQALVDAHLVEIPRLGTFTVGCLTGVVTEGLGRETDGALDAELLLLCAADQFLAHLFDVGGALAGQSDPNAVGLNVRRVVAFAFFHGEDWLVGCCKSWVRFHSIGSCANKWA